MALSSLTYLNAEWMLERDINNMRNYYGMSAPELLETKYAKEIWSLFEAGKLTTETVLTGLFDEPTEEADVDSVLTEIKEAFEEEQERLARINTANDDED